MSRDCHRVDHGVGQTAQQRSIVAARAATMLGEFRSLPGTFATTREAFVSMVCQVLAMARPATHVAMLYARYLGTDADGNRYLGLRRRVDDGWARWVCDDAFRLLMESL
jgi:hypothetical protein